ncbi:hypothetical protein [Sphingomonas sp.]|uniref:ComEC/Rec2 family competence protein n=1 Tax=Sphingomonas sp. TaxID=28214 RepID=UPI002EDAD4B3
MPFLDDDFVDMRCDDGSIWNLYWGDEVELVSTSAAGHRIRALGHGGKVRREGMVKPSAKFRDTALLRLSMIDVQQGDGLILETPGRKTIFIDGGHNKLFARHAAFRFRGTSAADPLKLDLLLVTHGDADHFEGLNILQETETDPDIDANQRIFLAPLRYYHNGMVKRPGDKPDGTARKDLEMLGATTEVDGVPFVTGLVDDPADVPEAERNKHFRPWVKALAAWDARTRALTGAPMIRRRVDHLSADAFDFLREDGVTVELLGPISEPTPAGPGLRFLRKPPGNADMMLGTFPPPGKGSWSESHTINGHSIAFRLRYGNVRFMFTGDMNQESMARMRAALPDAALRSEILKTPHHGAADFDMEFLKEVGAVVSMISSGDEGGSDHIHPRATLMAALGKASRTTPAVIFCTELAAFFKMRGESTDHAPGTGERARYFGFERTNYGIIHIRTDGERVLAFTHSGERGTNEAYRFAVSANGDIAFAPRPVSVSAPKVP